MIYWVAMLSLSPENIIRAGGLIAIGGIVFAESGLLIGFFLPGDSLLFTAGFLASQGLFDIHVLALVCFVAAVVGDSVGYSIGNRMGPKLVKRPDGKIFRKEYLAQAESFYEKHGKKTIVMARFVPIVRTFAPMVAGIGKMHYRTFLTYNIIGGALWTLGLTYAGFYLGRALPWTKDYLEIAVIFIVLLSLVPSFIHVLSNAEHRTRLKKLPAVTVRRIRELVRKD